MGGRTPDLGALEQKLGYVFADRDILRVALAHASAISPSRRIKHSYQRLEFLGDRVLGLSVADFLYQRDAESNEGDLSRKLNAVVKRQTCAEVARELDLGPYIQLGESEARTGGANKDAILADVCEAVIGAIYCDGGLDKASKFVYTAFGAHLENAREQGADPKTELQEWAQSRGLPPPSYEVVKRDGPDHAPTFSIAVRIDGYDELIANGAAKKVAEHAAAIAFLEREKIGNH